jgi:hypothetical protein
MATLLNYETGRPEEVDDEEVPKAVASGTFGLPKGDVAVISPDGQPGFVPSSRAAQAFAAGYRFETARDRAAREKEEALGGAEGGALAAGAGALRGATLGLSDVAMTELGFAKPSTLKALEEAQPEASVGGEVGGTLLSLLVPGAGEASAAGTVAKLSKAAAGAGTKLLGKGATSVGGRLATRALEGAVEGTFYGAGHALSQAAIKDEELTAEKLLSEAGMGALIGFGGGALGEGLIAGGSKAIQVGRELSGASGTIADGLREFAANRAVKAAGAIQSNLNKLRRPELAQEIGGDLLDLGIVSAGKSPEQIRLGIREALAEKGKAIGGALRAADEASGGKAFDLSSFLAKARTEVVDELASDPVLSPLAKNIEKQLRRFEAAGSEGVSFAQANKWKGSLQKTIKKWADSDAKQDASKRLQGLLDDEIEGQLAARGLDLDAFKESKRLYGNLKEASKWGRRAEDAGLGNRFFSLTDQGLGAAAGMLTGGPLGLAAGLGGAVMNKVLRERASQVFADVANRLSGSTALSSVSSAFSRAVRGALDTSPAQFGAYSGLLANAAADGAEKLFATHAALSEVDPVYAQTMAQAGFPRETPEEAAALHRRAERLSALQHAIAKKDAQLDGAVKGFMSGTGAGPAKPARSMESRLKDFEKQAAALSDLVSNPSALAQRMVLGKALEDSPGIATAAAAAAQRGVEFLHSKLPKRPVASISPALDRPWRPSDLELARFERYADAVNNPATVIEQMQRGTLTKEAVEAIGAVYPKLHEDIRSRFMEQMVEAKTRLDFRRRAQLENLFGQSLGDTNSGARFAMLQSSHAQAQAADAAAQRHQAASGKAPNIAQGLSTTAQRTESRGGMA